MVQRRDAILEKVLAKGAVPSLSPLVVKLVNMASDDEASAKDLAGVIEQSPGLTVRLLRLVNSPAHRVSEDEVTGVQRAVVLLGLREVRIMALSISLRDTLPVKKDQPVYHAFWRSSLHRASLARQTALELIPDLAEEAFVAGLLLDLGLPLLLGALEENEADGFPGVDRPLETQLAWERENLGLDHRELGVMLLERWELPRSLRDCLTYRLPAEPDGPPDLPAVSDFARRAAEALFSADENLTGVHHLAGEALELTSAQTNHILASAMEYLGQAADALEIDLDHEADLMEVMEKANAALGRISSLMVPAIADAARSAKDDALKEQAMVNALEAVAHEIRNPLMSVGGFARRLAGQASGEGKVKRYAEVIVNEAARLDQALGEMLSLVTPFVPKREPVDLAALASRIAEELPVVMAKKLGGRKLEIKLHLPEEPIDLKADPKGLSEALLKMTSFAVHLLPKSGAEPMLHIHLKKDNREAILTLFGEGEPAPLDDARLAGKSFGPELALAQARRIVEGHGGYLSVGSSPKGKGFVLTATVGFDENE